MKRLLLIVLALPLIAASGDLEVTGYNSVITYEDGTPVPGVAGSQNDLNAIEKIQDLPPNVWYLIDRPPTRVRFTEDTTPDPVPDPVPDPEPDPEPIVCTAPQVNVDDSCVTTDASCQAAGWDLANGDATGCLNNPPPPDPDPEPPHHHGNMPMVDKTKNMAPAVGSGTLDIKETNQTIADGHSETSFRLTCVASHMANDDPIVYPNQEGASHHHTFFGNTSLAFDSDLMTLSENGNSTCFGGIANRSGYWVPSLIDTTTGAPLVPSAIGIYYKSGFSGQTQMPPLGLRMIAGDPSGTPSNPQGSGWREVIRYACNDVYAGKQDHILSCSGKLSSMIRFMNCWDGVNLDSADHKSHMAYSDNGSCPASHPVAFPNITEIVHYQVSGTGNLRLASDNYVGGAGGYSLHADWVNGWQPEVMETWLKRCLNSGKDCHQDLLGNGQSLFNKYGQHEGGTAAVPLRP